jgi:alkane 1-monooxygenase
MKDLKYLMAYSVPLSVIISFYFKGVASYTALAYVFVFIPLIESILPIKQKDLIYIDTNKRSLNRIFDWLLYLNVPIVYTILGYGFYNFSTVNLNTYENIGLVFALGILLATNAVNVAHELGHRKSKFEVLLTRLLLLPCMYMHFTIEHNHGHHKYVATDLDPATAKKGQSLYHFWVTSVLGQYKNAWRIQTRLLKKNGARFLSFKNNMLLFVILQLAYLGGVYMLFGFKIFLISLIVGIISFLFLETINYIEHYGLVRKEINGKYEKVQNIHSWNSNHVMGRIVLYELTRHSDHHYRASKKYQVLESLENSPTLPFGYPGSMIIATLPPLWYAIMHPKL